jgi:hypothetical protein
MRWPGVPRRLEVALAPTCSAYALLAGRPVRRRRAARPRRRSTAPHPRGQARRAGRRDRVLDHLIREPTQPLAGPHRAAPAVPGARRLGAAAGREREIYWRPSRGARSPAGWRSALICRDRLGGFRAAGVKRVRARRQPGRGARHRRRSARRSAAGGRDARRAQGGKGRRRRRPGAVAHAGGAGRSSSGSPRRPTQAIPGRVPLVAALTGAATSTP